MDSPFVLAPLARICLETAFGDKWLSKCGLCAVGDRGWLTDDTSVPPWDVPQEVFEAYLDDGDDDEKPADAEPVPPFADPPTGPFDRAVTLRSTRRDDVAGSTSPAHGPDPVLPARPTPRRRRRPLARGQPRKRGARRGTAA